jgi:3-hydroxybutyryl-CoA dehydratase
MALLSIDDIEVGDSYSEEILFNEEKMAKFVNLTQDTAAIHINKYFSEQKGFHDLVVHGLLLSIQFSRILGMEIPGENTVIGSIELNFHAPVYLGDTVKYTATVKRILYPLGTVLLDLKIQKLDGKVCAEGKTTCVFKGQETSPFHTQKPKLSRSKDPSKPPLPA